TFSEDGNATYTPEDGDYGDVFIDFTVMDSLGHQTQGQWRVVIAEVIQVKAKTSGGSLSIIGLLLLSLVILIKGYQQVMLKKKLVLLFVALVAPFASANSDNCANKESNYKQCDNQVGWYIGGDVGYANTDIDEGELNDRYQTSGVTATSLEIDDADMSFSLLTGYQFSTYFAVEGAYKNLGARSVAFAGESSNLDQLYESAERIYPLSTDGLSMAVIGSWPLTKSLKISGKLGYYFWDAEYTTNSSNTKVGSDDVSGRDIWFGGELNYRISDNYQGYFSAERFEIDRDENINFSLGIRYFFIEGNEKVIITEAPVVVAPEVIEKVEAADVVVVLDSDNDGVIDDKDACVDSDPLYLVDNFGCVLEEQQAVDFSLVIYFEKNSSEIAEQYIEKIEALANFISTNHVQDLNVYGHTSASGPSRYNLTLSQQRAESVANVLVNDFNISPDIIKAIGKGETELLDQSNTEEANALNRRIELNIEEILVLPVKKE
ncbi:MAG: OmpA family protein, partial [Alteromonadales bacterium]|nr:OmpA family protein [Alteromonadales bacterium]